MSQLIILRGNSASGKTTAAIQLQHHFPKGKVMRISQDDIRINILNVKDRIGQPTADLIKQLAEFGKDRFDIVVIEGILGSEIYQEMFEELYQLFEGNVLLYYYNIPFEETLKRHSQRGKASDFGAERMKKWWLDHDYLGLPNERSFTSELSQADILAIILKDLS